ncbi:MAG: pyruvate:ferredoxin (flavodoxin) oxidoreductase [Synechococcaceae cyanobacterium]
MIPAPFPAAAITIDGNEAVARVAYRLSEVIALYPITPATPMGEAADAWAAAGRPNLWGSVPSVVEMQSEGGAAGALHGALQAGCLATSFTASQGLLLMLPNLYRWAGELTPVVLHVACRALAAQALSIFGDQSDLMAARGTGCAILVSSSVQEAGDFAAIAARASLLGRLPFLHGFDGFRTSHEIQKVAELPDALLQALVPPEAIAAHRRRALSPDHPVLRGTAQNPDVAFQGRESVNRFHDAMAGHVAEAMQRFASLSGRRYGLVDYVGAADAERVVVAMGSACGALEDTVEALQAAGERVGLLKLRLFRPFPAEALARALPASVRAVAVLDRCKEPGSLGEPLYLDVLAALAEQWAAARPGVPLPQVLGGRYGLASKEFTPAMAKAVFDHLVRALEPADGVAPRATPSLHFTVGIVDDVTHRSLPVDPSFVLEGETNGEATGEATGEVRAIFHGLGSDGTVGANKSTIKIIGESTDLFCQAYFVYDSKKAGSLTTSHLRFGPRPIRASTLIQRPTFVACHQWDFVERLDLLAGLVRGGTLLLNSPWSPQETWRRLPAALRDGIRARGITLGLVDAAAVARQAGLGPHINTVMQVAFFAISGVLPRDEAIARIRAAIEHDYARKGEAVVRRNLDAVDATLDQLQPLDWSPLADPAPEPPPPDRFAAAPPFVREVIQPLLAQAGDALPVSALPCDGTFPTGTARWEKRNIAAEVPVWESDLCIQCGKCVLVCPHAVIRAKVSEPAALAAAPEGFRSAPARDPAFAGQSFTIQVALEDCTGCRLCVEVCPARDRQEPRRKAINMAPQRPLREAGRAWWAFFEQLADPPRQALDPHRVNQQQLQRPLFEFSGACAGCGETPYLKLASQLFGDRMLVANATGCSSIYGGNLPTTPWSVNAEGRGPAWSNSLFEDNAEFGYGLRVALDQQRAMALELLASPALAAALPADLVAGLRAACPEDVPASGQTDGQADEAAIAEQRQRLAELKRHLAALPEAADPASPAARLLELAESLVKKSVWLVGGDGWAYDIGFGGLDHVLASGRDVNVLVLDTEVYSNTGGQMSKATPLGAVAKFAAGGKGTAKKDLGLMAMSYGHVYVASVAMGARDEHTIRAFLEAESYPGPSLILAYSHCIAHGIDMARGMEHQKLAVESGRWLLYRHDPRRAARGENPLQLDSRSPRRSLQEAMEAENRFRMLRYQQPERAQALARAAAAERDRRLAIYQALATPPASGPAVAPPAP